MQLQEHDTMAEKQSEAREILKDARFEEDQAEAIIATVNLATENLATKDDVEELRGEMQEGFKLLNQRMDFSDERTNNKFAKILDCIVHYIFKLASIISVIKIANYTVNLLMMYNFINYINSKLYCIILYNNV